MTVHARSSRQNAAGGDLVAVGAIAGSLCWAAVGAFRAATESNYPWNVWTPIALGGARGVLLGALAGLGAWLLTVNSREPRQRAQRCFAGALTGGAALGTVRNLLGPPSPLNPYVEAAHDHWYGSPLLAWWAGTTLLPAAVCAAALTILLATLARTRSRWPTAMIGIGLVLLAVALVLLPSVASSMAPEIEGNGKQVNEGSYAVLAAMAAAIPPSIWGVVRLVRLARSDPG